MRRPWRGTALASGKFIELDLMQPRLDFKTVFHDGTTWTG